MKEIEDLINTYTDMYQKLHKEVKELNLTEETKQIKQINMLSYRMFILDLRGLRNIKTNKKDYIKKAKEIRKELDSHEVKITIKDWMNSQGIYLRSEVENAVNVCVFKTVYLVRITSELEKGIMKPDVKWWERLGLTKIESKELKRFCKENDRW